jgi:hypothetical protein
MPIDKKGTKVRLDGLKMTALTSSQITSSLLFIKRKNS